MNFKKLIEDVLSESQLTALPEELLPEHMHLYKGDIDTEKDWDDFSGGQLVNHLYYKSTHKIGVDFESLQYGNSTNSFYSMFENNTTIEIYTKDFIDTKGMFATLGESRVPFLATSVRLDNFSLTLDKETKPFLGKIILTSVVKYLSDQLDEGTPAPTINIEFGKVGETIKVPKLKGTKKNEAYDRNAVEYEVVEVEQKKPVTVEVFFPEPIAMLGLDITSNTDGTPLTDKRIIPRATNLKPKTFPVNPFYCIVPAQFNIPSIDNYGFTAPSDPSNGIKVLMANQTIASGANAAQGVFSSAGLLGKIASSISTAGIGLGQKFFGDKGTLANSLAIAPKFIASDSDGLKLFVQGDGAKSGGIIDGEGYLNIDKLEAQQDYIEVNQGNGEFGKYGKPMSPSENNGFNDTTTYRGLGLNALKTNAPKIPALATPFASGQYSNLKMTDKKADDFLKWGVPRIDAKSGDVLAPMMFPETWDIYVRNMFFRPDPYSFWNWPVLIPAEMGIYNVEKRTSIGYDVTSPLSDVANNLGVLNELSSPANMKDSMWNKTIRLDQISNNDLYDPNKTFASMRYEFDEGQLDNIYQIQMSAFTSSIMEVALLDENNEVIRKHKFNTQGRNVGTSASMGTVVQF